MKKNELIKLVATQTGQPQALVQEITDCIFGNIGEQLSAEEEVTIPDFGVFKIKTLSARIGRNPSTGEKIEIPERKVPSFKPSKGMVLYKVKYCKS